MNYYMLIPRATVAVVSALGYLGVRWLRKVEAGNEYNASNAAGQARAVASTLRQIVGNFGGNA